MAFLGGSITEGEGSSSVDRCFTSIVTAAVAEQFPDTKVSCINVGVGGTTSALGLFRLQRDVLDKEPDILFVNLQ